MYFSPNVKKAICNIYVFVVAKPPAIDSGGLQSYNKKRTEQASLLYRLTETQETE